MYDLSSPRTRAYYAAMYEAEQAERDYSSAYRRMAWAGALAGSPEDYAVFSAGGYADSAHRVVRDMPVMERSDDYPAPLLLAARQWLKEIQWADLEPRDVDMLTRRYVVRGIERHYDGGWSQFVADQQ